MPDFVQLQRSKQALLVVDPDRWVREDGSNLHGDLSPWAAVDRLQDVDHLSHDRVRQLQTLRGGQERAGTPSSIGRLARQVADQNVGVELHSATARCLLLLSASPHFGPLEIPHRRIRFGGWTMFGFAGCW